MPVKIKKGGPPKAGAFPFSTMKKGEHFCVPDASKERYLRTRASQLKTATDGKKVFSVRREGKRGICVYRTK